MIDNKLKEIAKKLNIRFANAELSKNLGFSKGVVSEYLNNKKRVSQNFIEELENYYEINYLEFLKSSQNELNEPQIEYKPEGKIVNIEDLPVKDVYIVPIKGRGGLESSYFADEVITKLKKEKLTIKKPSSNGSKWFKIEVEGISMDDSTNEFDGSKYSLCEGDWAYCRSIPRVNWRNKLHLNKVKVFCFFHNTRGIIFKKVKSHNVETGDLILTSLNQDKKQFPDFKINVGECTYICNVIKVLSEF